MVHRGSVNNAARFLTALVVIGFLALVSGLMLTAVNPATNVPVAEALNDHALQKHAEASMIFERYETGEHECLRVYRSTFKNRLLYRFTYAGMILEGGLLATTSGKPVTAYMRTSAGWEKVIIRDGFVLVLTSGKCERERG